MKRGICAAAALCCLLTAAGCTAKPAGENPASEVVSFAALPGVDLASLLTAEEISAGLGCRTDELTAPLCYDDGASVRYADSAYTVTLDVHVQRPSAELRRYMQESCAGLETAPNLGDAAYFDRENAVLTVFYGEYVLTVTVDAEASADERRGVARYFAALIGERLVQTAA